MLRPLSYYPVLPDVALYAPRVECSIHVLWMLCFRFPDGRRGLLLLADATSLPSIVGFSDRYGK